MASTTLSLLEHIHTLSASEPILENMHIYPTHSSQLSSTLFHYSALSTASSTLFHYAPLSSTTTISHVTYHTTTTTHFITTTIRPQLPASTSQWDSSIVSSHFTPSSTQSPSPSHSAVPVSERLDSTTGLTIAVLILLVILTGITGIIWWIELHACKDFKDQESQMENPKPVGLGIMMQPRRERRREIEYRERLRAWLVRLTKKAHFANTMKRWTDSAAAVLRAELGIDAEEGLLLPVQEKERLGGEKDEIGINVDSGRNSSIIEKL